MATTTNTKNSIVLTRGITSTDSPSCVNQETIEKLTKNVLTNMSTNELKEEEGNVLCKMAIKGKASKLKTILDDILNTYYQSPYSSNGVRHEGKDEVLKVTFMIEDVKKT